MKLWRLWPYASLVSLLMLGPGCLERQKPSAQLLRIKARIAELEKELGKYDSKPETDLAAEVHDGGGTDEQKRALLRERIARWRANLAKEEARLQQEASR